MPDYRPMRHLLLPLMLAQLLMAPAAGAQTFTVIDQTQNGIRPGVLAAYESRIEAVSQQVADAWGTPVVHFGSGGWPVYLETGNYGYHSNEVGTGKPVAVVGWQDTLAFSHEVFETLEDPYGHGPEICDPVQSLYKTFTGQLPNGTYFPVYISDFVTPAWYNRLLPGPLDGFGYLSRARAAASGHKNSPRSHPRIEGYGGGAARSGVAAYQSERFSTS